MPSYLHTQLIDQILRLDAIPDDQSGFAEWIMAGAHLDFLERNANQKELVIFASGPFTFLHSLIVRNEALSPLDEADLLRWNGNAYTSVAGYCYGGPSGDVSIDRDSGTHGSKSLEHGMGLVFGRTFEGWRGKGRSYFELNQELAHLAEVHWRPEHRSYCRYDELGDLDHVVSVSTREEAGIVLVTFKWDVLREYLAISNMSLVRMFDLTLLRRHHFTSWGGGAEEVIRRSPNFFYRRKSIATAAYTRGVQVVPIDQSRERLIAKFRGENPASGERFAEFIIHDWRNNALARVTTHPGETTNYFDAEGNSLPFELSPAFFRPEVLAKYKSDREKYQITPRDIHCRSSWYLRGYDLNDAGQVHAYICDLRRLPYAEQLHWAAHNEEPKAGISERAMTSDFMGQFTTHQHPREAINSTLKKWQQEELKWWVVRNEDLFSHANPPVSESKDEWANAYLDLSQLIVEGFQGKAIKAALARANVRFEDADQSIRLLERAIKQAMGLSTEVKLEGLRLVQKIRSKAKSHAGSSEGQKLTEDAIAEHGSFSAQFRYVCDKAAVELEMIERTYGLLEAA